MPDNDILPATGTNVATDDIGGVKYQRMKLIHGVDGVNDGDVSSTNPLPVGAVGELIESLEAMRMSLHSLTRSIGQAYPDTANRLRVVIDAISASLTLATITTVSTVTTVTTVTTVSTVSNQTQIGGVNANQQIPALMQVAADALRRNIVVS